jgi:hypothetical protein
MMPFMDSDKLKLDAHIPALDSSELSQALARGHDLNCVGYHAGCGAHARVSCSHLSDIMSDWQAVMP